MRFFINTFIIMLFLVFSVQASKLGEGRKQVSGTFMFQNMSGDLYENGDGDSRTFFSVNPSAIIFLSSPGLAAGASLSFSNSSQGDFSSSSWGIGPVVQYYMGADEDKDLYPFVSGAFQYTSMSFESDFSDSESSQTRIRLAGGVLYFLNDYVGINGQVTFDMDSFEPDVGDTIDGTIIGVEAGFSIFID